MSADPIKCGVHRRCNLPHLNGNMSGLHQPRGRSLKYGRALYPCLVGVQLKVSASFVDQLLMSASLNDLAILNHKDLIRLPDGAQPMGNNKCRPASHKTAQAFLYVGLRFSVQV